MHLEFDTLVGMLSGSIAVGAGGMKLAEFLFQRRNGSSQRPPVPACLIDPSKFERVHGIVTAVDQGSLAPLVHNKPDVERAIIRQTVVLEQIRDLLRKATQ